MAATVLIVDCMGSHQLDWRFAFRTNVPDIKDQHPHIIQELERVLRWDG